MMLAMKRPWTAREVTAFKTRHPDALKVGASDARRISKKILPGSDQGLQASHETGHDDDGQNLHRSLRANGKKVIAHRPADLGKVGIRSAQLDTNPQIGRQQVAEALDRH